MFVPRTKKKYHHEARTVSRRSANRFIAQGLRIIAAKPFRHLHQTLTFPAPTTDAQQAKAVFTRFIKGVLKVYSRHAVAVFYVQERRRDGTIHFHASFLFFDGDNLPFAPSRLRRDFRTDIFRRWQTLNPGVVHDANELNEHVFNLESLRYPTRALLVSDAPTTRGETVWWGVFNKEAIGCRSTEPTPQQVKEAFGALFKRSSKNIQPPPPDCRPAPMETAPCVVMDFPDEQTFDMAAAA